jgi:cell division protein FtsN
MWLMGMIDAYIEEDTDDEAVLDKKRMTIWHKLLNAMEIIVICGVVITIVMATFPGFEGKPAAQTKKPEIKEKLEIEDEVKAEEKVETEKTEHEEPVFFSIQVGAFADPRSAKKVHDQLRRKGYQVRLESPSSMGDRLHRILIGKFSTEQHATWVGEELKKREGVSYVIVERKISGG